MIEDEVEYDGEVDREVEIDIKRVEIMMDEKIVQLKKRKNWGIQIQKQMHYNIYKQFVVE